MLALKTREEQRCPTEMGEKTVAGAGFEVEDLETGLGYDQFRMCIRHPKENGKVKFLTSISSGERFWLEIYIPIIVQIHIRPVL